MRCKSLCARLRTSLAAVFAHSILPSRNVAANRQLPADEVAIPYCQGDSVGRTGGRNAVKFHRDYCGEPRRRLARAKSSTSGKVKPGSRSAPLRVADSSRTMNSSGDVYTVTVRARGSMYQTSLRTRVEVFLQLAIHLAGSVALAQNLDR